MWLPFRSSNRCSFKCCTGIGVRNMQQLEHNYERCKLRCQASGAQTLFIASIMTRANGYESLQGVAAAPRERCEHCDSGEAATLAAQPMEDAFACAGAAQQLHHLFVVAAL